jgi:hypothetical protein
MNYLSMRRALLAILVIVILAGCTIPTAPPVPTLPPILTPGPIPTQPPNPMPPPGQSEVIRFVQTVQVTPDEVFSLGSFVRIGYIRATGNLAVVFTTPVTKATAEKKFGDCQGAAQGYREYTLDMRPTGKSGVLNCKGGDSGGIMIDDYYYSVTFESQGPSYGWRIFQYDPVTWKSVKEIFYPVKMGQDQTLDPLVSFANGQLIVGGGTSEDGKPPPPDQGGKSHLNFFSLDLTPQTNMVLSDAPHRPEGSILYVDGLYSYVTSNAYVGDMIVMQYDKDWKFLTSKTLRKNAQFVTGAAFDDQRYYVAFMDIGVTEPGNRMIFYPNIHLAAFDRDWNLIRDIAVTRFGVRDQIAGRPWIVLQGNRLYVSYDVMPFTEDPTDLSKTEAFVGVYEIMP